MPTDPAVTVLMPIYNGAAYAPEAIDSILAQTFGDFELLIVDDGSTDGTGALLEAYARGDPRIRLFRNRENAGLTRRLNEGLALARGAYIARMDGDDVSLPERLERQVAFMQANPRVGICGAWVQKIGELGYGVEHYPSDDADIRCHLLFANVLAHPAAIMRRSLFAELGLAYDSSYQRAQDYDLWVRAAEHVALANIPQVLLRYRMHRDQAGQREQEDQDRAAMLVRRRLLERLGLQPSAAELALHQAISASRFQPTRELVAAAERWLRALAEANRRAGRYDKAALARLLAARWYTLCRLSTALGPWVWRIYRRSPLRRPAPVGWPRLIKFALKCMARSPSL